MAEGNQPQRKNLAEIALRRNYVALHDALAQPRVAADLAIKLYGGVIITPETRDEILTPGIPCTQQAYSLLRAVESSIKMDHTRFQKFVRMVKKQPVLKPIATQLRQCYSALVSEARLAESSSSGSDTDSTEQHQSQEIDISGSGISRDPSSHHPQTPPKPVPFETPPVSPTEAQTQPTRKRKAQEPYSDVKQRINQLEQTYYSLVSQTKEVVRQQSPSVEDFRHMLTLLPTEVKGEHQKYLKELVPAIYRSETIEEIFGHLNLLWNFLSFSLLQHIIRVYGDKELNRQIEEYSTSVQAFSEETSLHAFLSVQPKRRYLRAPADLKCHLKEVMFKHKTLTMDSPMSEVDSYRQQLACEYSLPDFAVFLEQIKPGSLSTVWLVPAFAAATMKEFLQRKQFDFLQKHSIIQMKIDGRTVYPSAAAATEIEISDLEFGDPIKEGGTATVYRGHWKSRGLDVAIKTSLALNKKEVECLSSVSHPHIISLYGAVMKKPNYYIVTEFAEHGSLHDYLHEVQFKVDYKQRLKWAMQIAKGMNYLHKMRIMHRDLKPHNVLITEDLTAKICDFGAAKTFERTTAHTTIGTFKWMAPEVLNEEPYSFQCDIYSFGMILYELLFCAEPFPNISAMEAAAKIRNGEKPDIPGNCEPFLSTLLTKCWEEDPKVRPSFASIVSILDSKGFNELSKVFLRSLQKMVDAMEKTLDATKKAKSALSSLTIQLRNKEVVPLVDSAAYQEARTIPELMKSMSPCWNCLSTGLLEAVVKSSESSAAASALHDFKSARESSSHLILVAQAATASGDQKPLNHGTAHFEHIRSCQPAVFARLAGHLLCASVSVTQISVEVDQAILYLTDYDRITEAVVAFLKLPAAALVYCGCSENPLALYWEVSRALVGHISAVIPGFQQYRQLLQYNVKTLSVRDEISYICPNVKEVELWEAALAGHADKILDLLKCVAADVVDFACCTALVYASYNGHCEAAKILITAGAKVNHQIKTGASPLYIASQQGHGKVAEILLDHGADINLPMKDGATPLFIAAQNGHANTVDLLVSAGADLNLQRENGCTPLYIAAQQGHANTVDLLISAGADLNLQHEDGATPLYIAVQNGHANTVDLLVSAGADLNLQRETGASPLLIASQNGHGKVAEILLGHGADINLPTKNGDTPLIMASWCGHPQTVELLVRSGADINTLRQNGWTPLICAAIQGHEEVAELLLTLGANPNILDKDQETAVMKAAREGHIGVVTRLLHHGANIKIMNKKRETALDIARRDGHTKVCEELSKYY